MARALRTELQGEVARLQQVGLRLQHMRTARLPVISHFLAPRPVVSLCVLLTTVPAQALELAKSEAALWDGQTQQGGGEQGGGGGDDGEQLARAEGEISQMKQQLAVERGQRKTIAEELASLKGMLEAREEGVEPAGGREMALIEAVAQAKREAGAREGVVARLTAELEQAKAGCQKLEGRVESALAQVQSLQAAYQQARKYIADLEASISPFPAAAVRVQGSGLSPGSGALSSEFKVQSYLFRVWDLRFRV